MQNHCSCGAAPQQDLANDMGHTVLHGARYHQAMAIPTPMLQMMGKVPFLALFTPNWPLKGSSQAGWASSKHSLTQLRELYIPLLLGLPRALCIGLWPGRRRLLPNHIVNCFTAACESQSCRQYITSGKYTISEVRSGVSEERCYLLLLREAVGD